MSGILTTNANGEDRCAKSASLCAGCRCGFVPALGARAELPETKDKRGLGPRMEEVTWVARGLRKISRSKYCETRGGSCWMVLFRKIRVGTFGCLSYCQDQKRGRKSKGEKKIPFIIVIRPLIPQILQRLPISHHFPIQEIKFRMRDHVFENNVPITVE
jgi:hypothetical protein